FNHNAYIWGGTNLSFERNIITRSSNNGLNPRTGWDDGESLQNINISGNFFAGNAASVGMGSKTKNVVSRNLKMNYNVSTQEYGDLGGIATATGLSLTSFDGFEIIGNLFLD